MRGKNCFATHGPLIFAGPHFLVFWGLPLFRTVSWQRPTALGNIISENFLICPDDLAIPLFLVWLVVWNKFYSIENNHPSWHILQRGWNHQPVVLFLSYAYFYFQLDLVKDSSMFYTFHVECVPDRWRPPVMFVGLQAPLTMVRSYISYIPLTNPS